MNHISFTNGNFSTLLNKCTSYITEKDAIISGGGLMSYSNYPDPWHHTHVYQGITTFDKGDSCIRFKQNLYLMQLSPFGQFLNSTQILSYSFVASPISLRRSPIFNSAAVGYTAVLFRMLLSIYWCAARFGLA